MERKYVFLAIAVFWLAIILIFVGVKEFTKITGQDVILHTQPIDPRDMFRGDYIILSYQISRLDTAALEGDNIFTEGQTAYVTLAVTDGFANATGIYTARQADALMIRGKITSVQDTFVSLNYGIESYFVPEGRGWEIQRMPGNLVDVNVSIDKQGASLVNAILVNGTSYNFDS